MKRAIAAITLVFGITLIGAPSPVAGGSTTTVFDPVGDTGPISGPGSTPAFLDMLRVTVTKQAGRFEFSMMLAAPVPAQPVLPPKVKEIWWMWALDTDPTTFPFGFPRAPGQSFPPEFAIALSWNGTQFTAFRVDRRPTLSGGESLVTAVAFEVTDSKVTTFVDAATIEDPASFRFSALTRAWKGGPGTEGFVFTDYTGNPGTFHPWPS
jgi:hypothetical protein